ncbi:MAG: hypothetical protein H7840_02310 [Alphaproteobacteria bacterium]
MREQTVPVGVEGDNTVDVSVDATVFNHVDAFPVRADRNTNRMSQLLVSSNRLQIQPKWVIDDNPLCRTVNDIDIRVIVDGDCNRLRKLAFQTNTQLEIFVTLGIEYVNSTSQRICNVYASKA